MADVTTSDSAAQTGSGKKGKLVAIAAVLILAAAGFASAYLGFWSLTDLFRKKAEISTVPVVEFVDIPTVVLTIPGPTLRNLAISAKIETTTDARAQVEHLIPRVSDAFNTFLSGVDPAAFEKRGVLEIIRTELATRTEFILGADAFKDILITEFRLQ